MSAPAVDRAAWVDFLRRQADHYEQMAGTYPYLFGRRLGREPRQVGELRAVAHELRLLAERMEGPLGDRPTLIRFSEWR